MTLSRRGWLRAAAGSLAVGSGSRLRGQSTRKSGLTADEERAVAAVRAKATKAGLGPIEVRWTEHFIGVGDAPPEEYIAKALGLCESFAREFLPHFRERGFSVDFPKRRMMVIALKGEESYRAYSGGEKNAVVGGHYEVEANELVVFDFRPDQNGLAAQAKRVNTFTLIHETAHMLCYNTGLLTAGCDVPVAISEGLATYAELWAPPRDRSAFGRVNQPRLTALADPQREWIPIPKLLVDDNLFYDQKTEDLAYAEAWLLVHSLIKQAESLPKFRAYLAGLPKAGDKAGRQAAAEKALGPLRNLDARVRRYARTVSRPRGR